MIVKDKTDRFEIGCSDNVNLNSRSETADHEKN